MRHILFGDSIGFGVGDYQNGGWASQLRLYIDRRKQSKDENLINLSISGDTSRGLLARLENEAKLRIQEKSKQEFSIIIAIGTNDSKINKENPHKDINIEEFQNNISEIINVSQNLASEVMLVGLVPVVESLTTPYKGDSYYLVDRMNSYNQILSEMAKDRGLRFVDMFEDWMKKDLTQLFDDGLHPNTEGHREMYEEIKKQLFE